MAFCLLVCQMCGKGTFSQMRSHIYNLEIYFNILLIIYYYNLSIHSPRMIILAQKDFFLQELFNWYKF